MKKFKKKISIYQSFFVLIFFLLVSQQVHAADWQEPTCDPPDCNVSAPLNQGSTPQFKKGGLFIGAEKTRDNYLFSVESGKSYFNDDLEVGDKLILNKDTGLVTSKGGIILQGGSDLVVNNNGFVVINGDSSQLILKSNSISMIKADQDPAISIRDDNLDEKAISISVNTVNGKAIYGEADTGIALYGSASKLGVAGQFDGLVNFNSSDSSNNSHLKIEGGNVSSSNGSDMTIISPSSIKATGDITTDKGDLIVATGDISVPGGYISIPLDPVLDSDATNKRYVDKAISTGAGDDDWIINEKDIFHKEGNVGIGIEEPEQFLSVYQGFSPVKNSLTKFQNGIGTVELDKNDGQYDYGIYVDLFSGEDKYAAVFMNANVGIGVKNPQSSLQINSIDDKEALKIISANYSPLVIQNKQGNDLMRLNENGLLSLSCQNGDSDTPSKGLKVGDSSYIYDSSCPGDIEPADTTQAFQTLHIKSQEVIDIASDHEIRLKVNDSSTGENKYGIKIADDGAVTLGGWLQSTEKNSYLQNFLNISHFYTGAAATGMTGELQNQEMEYALFGRTGNTSSSEADDATYGGVATRMRSSNGTYSYYGVYGYAKGNNSAYSYGVVGETTEGTALRGNITGSSGNILVLDSPYFFNSHALIVQADGKLGLGVDHPSEKLDVNGSAKISGDLTVSGDTFAVGGGLDVSGDIISNGGITSAGDLVIGNHKLKNSNSSNAVSIEFDSNNNIVITLPKEGNPEH